MKRKNRRPTPTAKEEFGGGWSTRPPRKKATFPQPKPGLRGPSSNSQAPKGHDEVRKLPHGLLLLHEDEEFLVVSKPAGLLSIASGSEREKTAYWIISQYLSGKGARVRVAVVHRLDRDTSGVMVFAKTATIKQAMMDHWDELVSERRYVALAEGVFSMDAGVIDAPLDDSGDRVVVKAGGKPARTHWRRIREGKAYTLLSLELDTGRRNQIRAHLAYLGHPVAGDGKYGAKTDPLGRLALHAETLAFTHPFDGRLLRFQVPVPRSFSAVIAEPTRRNRVFEKKH